MSFQPLFEKLHSFALGALNIGCGGDLHHSGEQGLLKWVAAAWPPSSTATVFDVGANSGEYTQAALSAFQALGRTVQLHAFEPAPAAHHSLQKRVFSNPSQVKLWEMGLSDQVGSAQLFTASEDSGLTSLYRRQLEHFGLHMLPAQTVRMETLDTFCTTQKIDKINLLKMDIEGHELCALKGAAMMLAGGRIDLVQFEFGGCNIDSRTYFQDFYYYLHPHFEIYRVLKNGLRHLERYREEHEVFITTNFLAVRRDLLVPCPRPHTGYPPLTFSVS